VLATTAWQDAKALAEISTGLGKAMRSWKPPSSRRRSASPVAESELSRIGISLAGAFAAHATMLARVGHDARSA